MQFVERFDGVRIAGRSGFAGFDIVEVSPDFDTTGETTSILAARLGVEALCCLAAHKAGQHDVWRAGPARQLLHKIPKLKTHEGRNMTNESELYTIPARRGCAAHLSKGQAIKIINTHGAQVVDTWCFNADDLVEFMSMEHIRPTLGRIRPRKGDDLVTNRRRPILHLEEDTSPGIHDTLIAACDNYRYGLLGCKEYHDNCTDNLYAAMRQVGLRAPECPSPLNLWMNIPVDTDGNTTFEEPQSREGDYVTLRAAMDCVVVMSACPQDILPINGNLRKPTEAHFQIMD